MEGCGGGEERTPVQDQPSTATVGAADTRVYDESVVHDGGWTCVVQACDEQDYWAVPAPSIITGTCGVAYEGGRSTEG